MKSRILVLLSVLALLGSTTTASGASSQTAGPASSVVEAAGTPEQLPAAGNRPEIPAEPSARDLDGLSLLGCRTGRLTVRVRTRDRPGGPVRYGRVSPRPPTSHLILQPEPRRPRLRLSAG